MKVVIDIKKSSPTGFIDVYEEGDEWVKIKGCEECPKEQRIKCCGQCPCIMPDGGCYWQEAPEHQNAPRKSLYCMITPLLTKHNSRCCLEYKCVKGSNIGKIRRVKDKLNVFVEIS